jgi:hypothetical protein
MDTHVAAGSFDPSFRLPADMYYQLIHTLCAVIRPVSDSPEDLARRDNAVIAQIACLLPANGDEAELAAQLVAARAEAMHWLSRARQFPEDDAFALKCSAEAAKWTREARNLRALLLRVQASREKREKDAATADRAAWTEHCAIGLMANAMSGAPFVAMPEPSPQPPAAEPAHDEKPRSGPIALAEEYARIYPERAALIRRHGGVPPNTKFGPPGDDVIHGVVTGQTPALLALDRMPITTAVL